MELIYSLTTSIPFWSIAVQLLAVLSFSALQRRHTPSTTTTTTTTTTVFEFLFTVTWIVMVLENTIISKIWSAPYGILALGLRMFLTPMVVEGVHGNPCWALYSYLQTPPQLRNLSSSLSLLVAQISSVPTGICISLILWHCLATVSNDHLYFLDMELDHFLSAPPLTGFLVEVLVTFLMFLPEIFLPNSIVFRLLDTFFILFLVSYFGMMTGAFMNPTAALACWLMWHSRTGSLWEVGVHFFVFWLGPFLGTAMAAGVRRVWSSTTFRSKDKMS